ncbi:MAG: MaoC/PaaZ C-terminal domain-containing protein [Halioglobus sp.]|nr:MaoC/PaaZ C-terminal domain-containing protein [Halioglobus sp.]
MSDHKTLGCAEISVGDKLPSLDIDITTGLVVCGALATRDFEPVHHDKTSAVATGLPDVFMNILTSQGLMTRFATDWSGPEAVVKSLDLRLGAPNVPGMVMTMTGAVTAVDPGTGVVEVEVLGENNIWGMHMQGSVELALPKEA